MLPRAQQEGRLSDTLAGLRFGPKALAPPGDPRARFGPGRAFLIWAGSGSSHEVLWVLAVTSATRPRVSLAPGWHGWFWGPPSHPRSPPCLTLSPQQGAGPR